MDSSNPINPKGAASTHKRPTARIWYTILRGISFLLLIACLALAIVAFVHPFQYSPNCFDGVCNGYTYYSNDSFPPIWQTVTIGLALPLFGYELFRSLFGEKFSPRSHVALGLIIGFDVVLFLSFIGAVTMGLILSIWGWGIDMGLNFTLLAVALLEIAAMSFACRELRNRKHLKIDNLSNYMREVDSKLQALADAVARLEQRAGTLPPRSILVKDPAHGDIEHDYSPAATHPEIQQV